jgi:hypothetical protein
MKETIPILSQVLLDLVNWLEGGKMAKKNFDPEKYPPFICPSGNMKICLYCMGKGFLVGRRLHVCPKCGGFGLIKREAPEETESILT